MHPSSRAGVGSSVILTLVFPVSVEQYFQELRFGLIMPEVHAAVRNNRQSIYFSYMRERKKYVENYVEGGSLN